MTLLPDAEQWAYVSRHSCGHIIAIMVDTPDHRRDVAKFCGAEIRTGGTLEHITLAEFRKETMCRCFLVD